MIVLTNSLGSSFELPLTMDFDQVNINKRAEVQELALGGGVISGMLTYMPREFRISGSLFIGDREENNAFYDSLKQFLNHEPIEVTRGYNRYLLGYLKGLECRGLDLDSELELSINMIAPNPFFYGSKITEDFNVSYSRNMNISVDGSIETYPEIVVIVTSSTASGLKIDIGNNQFELTGELLIGDVIKINCKDFLVTLNGLSVIRSVNESFLINGLRLLPSNNNVIIELVGSADVSVSYRSRWV